MSNNQFPHILAANKQGRHSWYLRFVTDQDLDVGEYMVNKERTLYNSDHQPVDALYNVYKVNEIEVKRPAKGDWSFLPERPTYYEATVEFIGEKNNETVKEYLLKGTV